MPKPALLLGLMAAAALHAQQFFAMDTALVRNLRDDRVTRDDIRAVKRLGYSGLAMTIVAPERLKHFTDNVLPWMDAEGVKLTAFYWGGTVTRDGYSVPDGLKGVLPLLKGRATVVWFPIASKDFKPSDEAGDANAVALVREIADLAAAQGLQVSLYPHRSNLVERVPDAVRIVRKAGRKNVGVTMNLCHWLRVEGADSLEATVRLAAPYLTMVSVNGADRDAKNWIQPLGEGNYDVRAFLDTLKKAGYEGPVGLQGYSVAQALGIEPVENLRRSMEAWKSMASSRVYHVAVNGNDSNDGSAEKPLRTISAAARVAQPGDTITVHAGTYRERISPPRGGDSETRRITYQAATGEEVWIKGSEVVKGWTRYRGDAWMLTLPKSYFKGYNPYTDLIEGDWFNSKGRPHHTGEVYLNGKALLEAASLDGVLTQEPAWFTTSNENSTTIYANFHGKDPNNETVEINVRDSCFYPDAPGRNYITIRGFRMSHAATQWAAPTAEQIGLIGTHWSKGWIIEDNIVSDSRCSCITLGKERATGHNVWMNNPKKDGATHYNEVILRALHAGWSREKIGSHTVRNNTIFNCEQAGIAGSLGAIHSRITGNHIHSVWRNRQFTGAEMGGIKLHGAIDVLIANNRIHSAGRGLWMDWMAQGTRITSNLLYDNTTDDLFVEVNHGPFVVDNNLFLSTISLADWSEGGAYVHNLFAGKIVSRPELKRWTPYHRAHSTALAGVTLTKGGDNRFYNNVFIGGAAAAVSPAGADALASGYGTWVYDKRPFPSKAAVNVYLNGAIPYASEERPLVFAGGGKPEIFEDGGAVYLQLALDPAIVKAATRLVTTELLGRTQVAELPYKNYDGRDLVIGHDYFGKVRSKEKPLAGPFESLPTAAKVPVWR